MKQQIVAGLVACLVLTATPLRAQDSTSTRTSDSLARSIRRSDSTDAILLDIVVDPAANERHIVFLQKGLVYRARFGGPGINILMRSRGNKQLPFIFNSTAVADASGATEYEIYPSTDGDIEFKPVASVDQVPVRFTLWRDAHASLRRQNPVSDGRWEGGLEFAVGVHGPYLQDGERMGATGSTASLCLAFRNGRTLLGTLHGCAFGIESIHFERGAPTGGFFIQPRVRAIGTKSTTQGRGMDAGIVLHLQFGGGGSTKGFGIYGARDFAPGTNGRGWRSLIEVRQDWVIDGFADQFGATIRGRARVVRSQVSLGYYW